jgi:hypothetical protein
VIREVRVHPAVHQKAHDLYREERSAGGSPSEYDFTSGPLAAAAFAFRDFDSLPFDVVEAVRTYTIVDPVFGPVVFVGVLLRGDVVEIVDFSDDPDYWSSIEDDPS